MRRREKGNIHCEKGSMQCERENMQCEKENMPMQESRHTLQEREPNKRSTIYILQPRTETTTSEKTEKKDYCFYFIFLFSLLSYLFMTTSA